MLLVGAIALGVVARAQDISTLDRYPDGAAVACAGRLDDLPRRRWARPFVNLKIGLQYVAYTMFNGATRNYGGRNSGDNNTVFLYVWMAF